MSRSERKKIRKDSQKFWPGVHKEREGYVKTIKLSKIPPFHLVGRYIAGTKTSIGTCIPINKSLGSYENQVLPIKVTEHFIKKASVIVMLDCPCRIRCDCQQYDHTIGCTFMGQAAAKIDLSKHPNARIATVEEALERERLAYEHGLLPSFGRLKSDARLYETLPDDGHFMSLCHCCDCCCVCGALRFGNSELVHMIKRMEGLTVTVNRDVCIGCGECFSVCIRNAMEMVEGKAKVNSDLCV